MRSDDVTDKRFTPTRWREGYSMQEVDEFLDRVRRTLANHEQGTPVDMLSPEDVVNQRFSPTRFTPGYDQDEVDDYLDEVVVTLRGHEAHPRR